MRFKLGMALAVLLCLHRPAAALDNLDGILAPIKTEHGLPALAAAVSVDGEVVAAGAVGTRVAGKDLPVTVDDRFHLGSDTKAMTATLAGMLVDEGKLTWKSTVGEVLGKAVPGMSAGLQAVTLEQLLSHSSGIPSDTPEMLAIYFNVAAFDENARTLRLRAIDAWKHNTPVVPAGDSPFQYSNFGYMIAGAMIETAAGEPWEALIQERIFKPLGLATAGLGPQATTGLYDAPVGHRINGDGTATPMLWGAAADAPPVIGPAGIAHMSVLDFLRWGTWNAFVGEREPALVKPGTLAEIQRPHVRTPKMTNPPPGTPESGEYAFGWGVNKLPWLDRPVLTHNGSNGLNLAKILVDPERRVAIVAVTNFPGMAADKAAAEVLKTLYLRYVPAK